MHGRHFLIHHQMVATILPGVELFDNSDLKIYEKKV